MEYEISQDESLGAAPYGPIEGVDSGDPFAVSKSTRRDRAAHHGIVAAVANLGFLESCSLHLMFGLPRVNVLHPKIYLSLTRASTRLPDESLNDVKR
ncbi:hypothetical protein Y032_0141g2252 [Ancylostoma ceylanicum]|uniref:Uncharacterized protein n=1 Tax=Ancylostoma ceylanicum TaxID=53326 RepID=A0A016T448_9BILA|nr:hypothetical protein Y032_0141g2252 [Ancylostoma ceylanicum]